MQPPKVLFIGSIGAVAETSELQRRAYNQAFNEHEVDWNWSPDTYKQLLQSSGGIQRIELLSDAANQPMEADKVRDIHARKTELACDAVKAQRVKPRAGIAELVKNAKRAGSKVAWVTTTSKDNTQAILDASNGELSADDFDHIFHREDAEQGKPAADIYEVAMKHFDVKPDECLAVEDSLNSILSAKRAGIPTIATLGRNHADVPVEGIADRVYPSAESIQIYA